MAVTPCAIVIQWFAVECQQHGLRLHLPEAHEYAQLMARHPMEFGLVSKSATTAGGRLVWPHIWTTPPAGVTTLNLFVTDAPGYFLNTAYAFT